MNIKDLNLGIGGGGKVIPWGVGNMENPPPTNERAVQLSYLGN